MQKFIPFLLLLFVVKLASAQGQLQLFDRDGQHIVNGEQLFVWVEDLNQEAVSVEYFIRNNSNTDMTLKCVRTIHTEVAGSYNYFCALGVCWGPAVDEADAYLVEANTTLPEDNPFSGHYNAVGNAGTTEISYKFYNVDNPNDSISFTVKYSDTNVATNSLKLYDINDQEIMDGANLQVNVEDLIADETVSPEFFIRNDSDLAMDLYCQRTILENVEETSNYFCALGECLAPFSDITSRVFTLDANTTISEENPFSSHYTANGNPGVAKFHYRFFDANNIYDEFSLTVEFDGSVGLNDMVESAVVSAYPNPANDLVVFNIENQDFANSQLVIYDALGSIIVSINTGSNQQISWSASNLPNGVYFYRLEKDNLKGASSKLIIQ
jgi:hypothetical protein